MPGGDQQRLSSGLYAAENSGGSEFGAGDNTDGETGVCSEPAGVLNDISGMKMGIGGFSVPESALSIGGGERRRPLNLRRQNGPNYWHSRSIPTFCGRFECRG